MTNDAKVAVLRIPLDQWTNATPQEQLFQTMQQLLAFMASDYYADFEGLQIQAIDINNIAGTRTILTLGKTPGNGIIKAH